MNKKLACLFFSVLCIVLMAGCKKATKSEKQQVITLVMAEVNPPDSVCGQMDAAFKQKVEELSDKSIIVDVQYSGALGNENEVIKFMMAPGSSIQLARTSANLSQYGAKKSALITIPYTFANSAHFWKFASSDLAESFLVEPYELKLGVRGLCYAEEGFRNFFSTKKINSIEDLAGKKMRVSGKNLTDLAVALGAEPMQIPFTDLYMALQTGTVEVAEQPLTNYMSNSFHKVAPYMITDRHMLGAVQILINSECWDSLTVEQQDILKTSARYASEQCKVIVEEKDLTASVKLISEGVVIKELTDNVKWQKACEKVIMENSKDYPELYQQIVNIGK